MRSNSNHRKTSRDPFPDVISRIEERQTKTSATKSTSPARSIHTNTDQHHSHFKHRSPSRSSSDNLHNDDHFLSRFPEVLVEVEAIPHHKFPKLESRHPAEAARTPSPRPDVISRGTDTRDNSVSGDRSSNEDVEEEKLIPARLLRRSKLLSDEEDEADAPSALHPTETIPEYHTDDVTNHDTDAASRHSNPRRQPRKWTDFEVDLLERGLKKFGLGRWQVILNHYGRRDGQGFMSFRTGVDLKDKARNERKRRAALNLPLGGFE